MLNAQISYRVKGYKNRWGVVDTYIGYALLENETYGDETCYLVVKADALVENKQYMRKDGTTVMLPTIMEVVCETYDDLVTTIEQDL